MSRTKKPVNNSGIPQHEIEYIAQCILPDIIAFYESEEGQREFQEWKAQREAEAAERKAGKTDKTRKQGCHRIGGTPLPFLLCIQRMIVCHIVQILPDVVI